MLVDVISLQWRVASDGKVGVDNGQSQIWFLSYLIVKPHEVNMITPFYGYGNWDPKS